MAITVTPLVGRRTEGSRRRWNGVLTLDNSYPTGGYTLPASLFKLDQVEAVLVMSTLGGKPAAWNSTTSKLQVFSAVGTEVSNGTDLHTEQVTVEVIGV
jgi:hypothetical protein